MIHGHFLIKCFMSPQNIEENKVGVKKDFFPHHCTQTRNFFHCHNCGWHSNPTNWIIEVSSLTFEEVLEESKDYDILPKDVNEKEINEYVKRIFSQKLPDDSINLFDDTQLKFYNSNPIVQTAVKYIKDRILDRMRFLPSGCLLLFIIRHIPHLLVLCRQLRILLLI